MINDRYLPVLEPAHKRFLEDFRSLPDDAQCLYIRMLNRRGRIFDGRKFTYKEIQNITDQITILLNAGFVKGLKNSDVKSWFKVVTRDLLIDLISSQCANGSFGRSWPKSELIKFALHQLDFSHSTMQGAMENFIVQIRADDIGYLLFLFFGKIEQGLTRFTLRDLGVSGTSGYKTRFKPRFKDKASALNAWFYIQKQSEIELLDGNEFAEWGNQMASWPDAIGDQSVLLRQKVIYQLGERIEKYGETGLAEQVYATAHSWPASERLVRIVYARGDKQRAMTLLDNMMNDPSCDEELLFAEDFHQRKYHQKRTSRITDILRSGQVIKLDESFRNSPEEGAAEYFRVRGAQVFHSENRLWRKLFGLLFWELLFEDEFSSIYNDFERSPKDLGTGKFYPLYSAQIEKQLAMIFDTAYMLKRLLATIARQYGKANSIFRWQPDMFDEIKAFVQGSPAESVSQILRRMAKDYPGNSSGFPDLLVIKKNHAQFIEIKTEGDQLRRNQLKQIVALEQAGFAVEVNRVQWVVDPNQVYAVVDIETTGRRSATNRITEIGVVKIRNNQIIDEWQTLINPGRRISGEITRLTGIDNEMVSDAPPFSTIADTFRAFTEGAIFVAHNARFDYGFISDEYRRLDQSYHRPTLCSCVQMRKWYPGHRSYSLKNLCEIFHIDLDSHHRALCDAKAAAELLKLVNQKRIDA